MRKRFFTGIVLCMLLSLMLPAHAQQDTIRVGLPRANDGQAIWTDAPHEEYLMALLGEIAVYTDWRYTYVYGDTDSLLGMLQSGEIDMLAGVYERDTLADDVKYSKYISGYTNALLVASAENTGLRRNDFSAMQGQRIAVAPDTLALSRLESFLQVHHVGGTLVEAETYEEALALLRGGEVDLALARDTGAQGSRVIASIPVEPYYFVSDSRHPSLINSLDSAFSMILSTDPNALQALQTRYLQPSTETGLNLTDAERAYLQALPALRVAVVGNFAPLQSFAADGTAEGISVELMRHIADSLGIPLQILRVDSAAEAEQAVREGRADAALDMLIAGEGMDGLALTKPYLSASRIALVRDGVSYPHTGLRLALIPGMEALTDGSALEVVYADTFEDCVSLVSRGEADYTFGTSHFIEYSSSLPPMHNLRVVTLSGITDSFALGLRRPVKAALLTSLNKAILSIDPEVVQSIALNHTALSGGAQIPLGHYIATNPRALLIPASIVVMAVLMMALLLSRQRARHLHSLYRMQYTDELTGSLNLAGFRREAPPLLASGGESYALVYATVRNFQYVNDRYGYAEGDDILCRIADLYRDELGEGELFCRTTGGTFVSLRKCETREALFDRLDTLQCGLSRITPQSDSCYHLRMTAGIYLEPWNPEQGDIFSMMDRANMAQQQVAPSADVQYAVYHDEMFLSVMRTQELESRMESALENGEFRVYLQPKYNLVKMKPVGAEALVRWLDRGRLIPPDEFIPHFERNGFIARLDRFVFSEVCKVIRRWMDASLPLVPVSINVSRVQLYKPDFVESYVTIKNNYGIPDGMLELEFTESILFEDVQRLISIVKALRENGFECSIDDFGKGYSSLTMLKNIPADIIKLDAQFFESGIDEHRDTIVIESVVDIAKALGMTTIAEGIENQGQIRLLQLVGCDMAQGYLFSRPVDIESFEKYLYAKLVDNEDPFATGHMIEEAQA
ncbi:EAL domain-containing protein [Eubacteriales bacterium OttesenSCG-928-A19]|nr:EAL domain-containing protein [Eubacteriales bacterium OttesenSCG-928-A19]